MQINLKELTLTNFKGQKSLKINFNHVTSIYGQNEAGKTTVFDAFLWLFFGKNSEDRSKFEIKRLDAKNNFIQKVETEVIAIIHVDGQEIEVKKVLRQKWVTRKGSTEEEYSGDENTYFWNNVPLKEGEFNEKIKKSIGDEGLFKLITNPFKFNTMKWQERRNLLIDIAGDINYTEIIESIATKKNKTQFDTLITALNQGKSIDEFKKELAAKKKKIKDEMENIPSRVDEVRRGMPEMINFDDIRNQIETTTTELNSVQLSLNDENEKTKLENKRRTDLQNEQYTKITDKNKVVFAIKNKMQNIEFDVKQVATNQTGSKDAEIRSLITKITDKETELNRFKDSLIDLNKQVNTKEQYLDTLRQNWIDTDAKTLEFDSVSFVCPCCHQSLPETDIDTKKTELTNNFNTNKLDEIKQIEANAGITKQEIATLKTRISNGENLIKQCEAEIGDLKSKAGSLQNEAFAPKKTTEEIVSELLGSNAEYQQLKTELDSTLSIKIEELIFPPLLTNEELKTKYNELNSKRNELQKELLKGEQISKAEIRVKELQDQESALAQELATLEGNEFAIMHFNKAKVDTIEKRINGKFKYVSFKMFNKQVNGGEEECCDTLIKGVPFSDANNAGKINAGIDIINTLCQHYNISAPIFIDNRESVTDLIDSDSQIVNLIVSGSDKKLRVV